MFTGQELLQSFFIAIVLIFLFKLQRELFPKNYFATSDIIYGINFSPTRLDVIIRFLIIYLLGICSSFIIKDPNVIILGITAGSFLIIWPALLSEENIDSRVLDKKLLLYTSLILFVILTFLVAKLSVFSFQLGEELLASYLQNLNTEKVITLVIDNLAWMLLMAILGPFSKLVRSTLYKRVTLSNENHYDPYEDEEDDEGEPDLENTENTFEQVSATKETKIEE